MDGAGQDETVNAASAAGRPPSFTFLMVTLLAGQTIGTMGTTIIPSVAPKVAESYGIPSALVGYQISMIAVAMILALAFGSKFNRRWGSTRMQQIGLTLVATGGLVAILPHVAFFFLSSIALGLGYGMLTPSASNLLLRFTPAKRRNLIFSIKQTGVPLGWAAIALLAPVLTVAFSWRVSMFVVLAYSVTGALLLERWRTHWDDDRDPGAASRTNLLTGVGVLWRYPTLRYLAMAGFFFSFVQLCLGTFTVNLLVQEAGYGLVAAGAMLSLVQISGMAGRLAFGWIADRSGMALAVLALTSLAAAVGCVASLWIASRPPVAALAVFYALFGVAAYGWNGVMHAQIARLSPPGMVSVATGGIMVWIFGGILAGPALFAATYRGIGSYADTFGLLAVAALASAALASAAARAERRS